MKLATIVAVAEAELDPCSRTLFQVTLVARILELKLICFAHTALRSVPVSGFILEVVSGIIIKIVCI
jgi:hypothetical protein